jgi:hypothetical protein
MDIELRKTEEEKLIEKELSKEPDVVKAPEEPEPREILKRLFNKEIEVDFSIQSLREDITREINRVPPDKRTKRHANILADIKVAQDRVDRRMGLIAKTVEQADKWGRSELSVATDEWSRDHSAINKKDLLLHAEVAKMATQKEEAYRREVKRAIQVLQDKLQKDLETLKDEVQAVRDKINATSKPLFDKVHEDLAKRKEEITDQVGVFSAGLKDLRLEQIETLRDSGSVEYVVEGTTPIKRLVFPGSKK